MTQDPIVALARSIGLSVQASPVADVNWTSSAAVFILRLPFYFLVAAYYVGITRIFRGNVRRVLAVLGYLAQFSEPFFAVPSGVDLIDFLLPAISFLVFFHIVDLYFIRSEAELDSWSVRRLLMQIFCFPNESSFSSSEWVLFPFVSGVVRFVTRALISNVLLYFTPNRDILAQIPKFSPAWFIAHVAPGLTILCILDGIIGFGVLLIATLG